MSEEFDVYYEGTYHKVLNEGLVGRQMAFIHRLMERPFMNLSFDRILEVGAGIGEHLPYVRSRWNEYVLTDVRIDRLRDKVSAEMGISIQCADVTELPFEDGKFDRIISTCLLPHVVDPVKALAEIHRVSTPGASITIFLPCEPGMFLRLARSLTTIPKNKKLGVPDPYFLHFREHVHYWTALNHYLEREFKDATIRSRFWPFPFLTWNLNLFKIYQITTS